MRKLTIVVCLLAIGLPLVGCTPDTTPILPSILCEDHIRNSGSAACLQGDPGEFLSDGNILIFEDNLDVRVSGKHLIISLIGGRWIIMIAPPAGQPLRTGYFPDTVRISLDGSSAELDVIAENGCKHAAGEFEILGIVADGQHVKYLAMRFILHCEQEAPRLRGFVRYKEEP